MELYWDLFPSNSRLLGQKNRTALWLASNCRTDSGRERYVGELARRGLEVDVLGRCGGGGDGRTTECDRKECDREIHKNYR